jgi:hypothetical protein
MNKETKSLDNVLEEFDKRFGEKPARDGQEVIEYRDQCNFLMETYHTAQQDRDEELKRKIKEEKYGIFYKNGEIMQDILDLLN